MVSYILLEATKHTIELIKLSLVNLYVVDAHLL